MIQVLIICKENESVKRMINKILINIDGLKVVGIGNNLKEAQELIIKIQPDLIISSYVEILEFIKEKFISYHPGIVILSNKSKTRRNKILHIENTLPNNEIAQKISIFVSSTIICSQKEKIINLLSKLGFTFNLAGTVYLLDAILYTHTYKGSYSFETLSNDVYSYVAELNNSNMDRVRWSIARSINYMYDKHTKSSYKVVEKYLKIQYPEKPTPKLIISILANNLDL